MYVYYFHLLLGRWESVFPQLHSHIAFPWTLCTAVDQFRRVACLFCPASVPRQSHAAPNIRLCGPPFSHHLVAHADSFPGAVPARDVYHRHGRGVILTSCPKIVATTTSSGGSLRRTSPSRLPYPMISTGQFPLNRTGSFSRQPAERRARVRPSIPQARLLNQNRVRNG